MLVANIFTTENIQPFSKSGPVVGTGEWVTRNSVPAMNIRPAPFYKNLDNATVSGILRGYFTENTSYIVDLWIDTDAVIYNGNNVAGGLTIIYTDGTTEPFVFTGGNKGWQHKKVITPNTKTIKLLDVYYYTSLDVYYRWDSYITKFDTQNITKTGQVNTSNVIENQDLTSFSKGGSIYTNNFYEY